MSTGKIILSIFLLVVMVLSLIPTAVLAAENDENELDKLIGTYIGTYFTSKVEMGLTLTVKKNDDNQYVADFDFYPVSEDRFHQENIHAKCPIQ